MLDESMHKSVVSLGVGSGYTKGKEAFMVVSKNNPGPTFNNGEDGMLLTMVLAAGITLADAVSPCRLMVFIIGITLAGAVSPGGS